MRTKEVSGDHEVGGGGIGSSHHSQGWKSRRKKLGLSQVEAQGGAEELELRALERTLFCGCWHLSGVMRLVLCEVKLGSGAAIGVVVTGRGKKNSLFSILKPFMPF